MIVPSGCNSPKSHFTLQPVAVVPDTMASVFAAPVRMIPSRKPWLSWMRSPLSAKFTLPSASLPLTTIKGMGDGDVRRFGIRVYIDITFSGSCSRISFFLVAIVVITLFVVPHMAVVNVRCRGDHKDTVYLSRSAPYTKPWCSCHGTYYCIWLFPSTTATYPKR